SKSSDRPRKGPPTPLSSVAYSPFGPCRDSRNGGLMKRAILVALGIGAVITSAAALGIGNSSVPLQQPSAQDEISRARIQGAAREAHREAIDARYREVRAQCDALAGA